jgi:hypothetical protein
MSATGYATHLQNEPILEDEAILLTRKPGFFFSHAFYYGHVQLWSAAPPDASAMSSRHQSL